MGFAFKIRFCRVRQESASTDANAHMPRRLSFSKSGMSGLQPLTKHPKLEWSWASRLQCKQCVRMPPGFLVLERQLRDVAPVSFRVVSSTSTFTWQAFQKSRPLLQLAKNESPELMLWRKESHSSTKPDQVPRKAILAKFHRPFFFGLFCCCKGLGFETFTGFLGGSARVLRRKFDTRSFAKFHKLFFSNFLLQRVWAMHLRIFLQEVQSLRRHAIFAKFHKPFFFELFCCKGFGPRIYGFSCRRCRVLRRHAIFAKFHKPFFFRTLLFLQNVKASDIGSETFH